MKLPQIPHIHKNRNFSNIFAFFFNQLLHPYKFHGRDMSGIFFVIFASCEPLIPFCISSACFRFQRFHVPTRWKIFTLTTCKCKYLGHLKVTKVLLLPLVPKGGSMELPWENHFSTGILQWNLYHICTGYKKSQFCKKILKCCSVSKWRPNNRLLFRVISILAKFWKTTFPKEFFNEIWLKEGEYE